MGDDTARCKGKPHFRMISPEVWEVKCDSRVCGAEGGVIVLHRFSTVDGRLIQTLKFRDPMKGVNTTDGARTTAPVRHS